MDQQCKALQYLKFKNPNPRTCDVSNVKLRIKMFEFYESVGRVELP